MKLCIVRHRVLILLGTVGFHLPSANKHCRHFSWEDVDVGHLSSTHAAIHWTWKTQSNSLHGWVQWNPKVRIPSRKLGKIYEALFPRHNQRWRPREVRRCTEWTNTFFLIISFYFMQCLCCETWSVPPVKISCCSCLLSSHRPAIQISADAHVFQSLCTGKQLDLKLGPLTEKISTLDLQSLLLLAYKHQRQLDESDVNSTSTYRVLYSSAVMLAYLFMN